ncbi:hypothetical protein [Ruegeria arenilitoris]|uniref:hypothetical protein n=1 Tax=Ruegeria arenilitoris TaxID=1173585 RepID=UPI00147DF6B4|nr:hypothetical protein [Ruegeria arenilitoris]
MDENFLQRATDIELRLEAEGMFLTAEAIRQVVNTYVLEHSEHTAARNDRKTSEEPSDLTEC